MSEFANKPDINESQPLRGRLAVVTGTSRGIGAEIAKSLALAGCDVVGSHVDPSKEKRQDNVAQTCRNAGVTFASVLADITDPLGRASMLEAASDLAAGAPRVNVLVLNAAGGLEEGKEEGWAEKINIEAQLELVDTFLPHMGSGDQIIYLTSLWAHNYGDTKQLAQYEPVARTKKAAEEELRNLIPKLEEKGVKLGILVGDVVKGTAAHTIFKLILKDRLAEAEQSVPGGKFPEAEDMGNAVLDMVLSPGESGFTKYLGRTFLEPFDRSIFEKKYEKKEVAEMLPMYNSDTLYVDTFSPVDMNSGIATYTVLDEKVAGHFGGEFEDVKLYPGHMLTEGAMQSLGLVFGTTHLVGDAVGAFTGVEAKFEDFVFPGEEVRYEAKINSYDREGLNGSCDAYVGDTLVGTFRNAKAAIFPSLDMAKRIYRMKKASRNKKIEPDFSMSTSN